MKLTKKQILLTLAAIIIIALVVWGFWPTSIPVRVEQASIAPLEVTIEEEGKTRVIDRYTVSAPVTGYSLRLPYEVGDTINTEQALLHIQPMPDLISARQRSVAEAQLEAAKARLEQARQTLELAKEENKTAEKDFNRLQNLFESGVGSEQGLDNARLSASRARTQLTSAEFAVKVAENELKVVRSTLQSYQVPGGREQIVIRSPVNGRLLSINHKSEGIIQAGTPILEIGDPLNLEVKADLLSTDAVQVQQGTPVRIKRWGSDKVLEGVVRVVEPSGYTRISALGVEEQRVPVIVDILSPREQWATLGDGFRVVVEFIIWQGEDVLQVPSSALFRTADKWALFVVEDNRATLRSVEVGNQSGLYSQITEGLDEGERVITHPDERIEDGIRIKFID